MKIMITGENIRIRQVPENSALSEKRRYAACAAHRDAHGRFARTIAADAITATRGKVARKRRATDATPRDPRAPLKFFVVAYPR